MVSGVIMNKMWLVVLIICLFAGSLTAVDASSVRRLYPGAAVLEQEMENHQIVLKTLQEMHADLEARRRIKKPALEEALNFIRASALSLEYLDSTWQNATNKISMRERPAPSAGISLPCACKGEGEELCPACDDDGYVWCRAEAGSEKQCLRCKGKGRKDGRRCIGCNGSGWANSFPTSQPCSH